MKEKKKISHEAFWRIRSANYDKLYWTKDANYLGQIIHVADLKKSHVVLDVGTGTGDVANAVKEMVRHVVAIDTSDSMLKKGQWTGTSVVKWDINESLFANGLFDRVFARMVFHHILDNLNRAMLRCYDLLKENGKIIIAEGVPPVNDAEVVDWYTEMFKFKEERRTFTSEILEKYLRETGFDHIKTHTYFMDNFSIGNWLKNSGLEASLQKKIMRMHKQASAAVQEAYQMRFTGNDCLVRTKNVIMVGHKPVPRD